MKMPDKLYQHGLCIWLASGLLILSGYLLYKVLTTPFEFAYLFLGWLIAGLILFGAYGIVELWDVELYL